MFALQLTTDCKRIALEPHEQGRTYEMINNAVGGWIENIQLTPTLDMYVNEEGKLTGLPYNPDATAIWWSHFGMSDVIVGDVVFCSHNEEGDTVPLTYENISYLEKHLGKLKLVNS